MRPLTLAFALSALAVGAGAATAQTGAAQAHGAQAQAAPTRPTTASSKATTHAATPSLAAAGADTKGHSAAAIDCSRQADAKGLHGKARASFRTSCKASAKTK